jgi:hypothetical protein
LALRLLEAPGDVGLEAGILALGIKWRTTALGDAKMLCAPTSSY